MPFLAYLLHVLPHASCMSAARLPHVYYAKPSL